MFTTEQIQSARNRYQLWAGAIAIPGAAGIILLCIHILETHRHGYRPKVTTEACMWGLVAASVIGMIISFRYIARKTLCRCPQCGSLIFPERTDYVLTKGKCPRCNHQLLMLGRQT